MRTLTEFSEGICTCQGDTLSWYGMPHTTRMTVVCLGHNRLWLLANQKKGPKGPLTEYRMQDYSPASLHNNLKQNPQKSPIGQAE